MNEHEMEPVRGLPEALPAGEQLMWQGEPSLKHLALRVFHIRKVAVYFLILMAIVISAMVMQGSSLQQAVMASSWQIALGMVAMGLLTLLAWLYSKTTVYSITNKRLVMRFGVAIPMIINVPWSKIQSAGIQRFKDGSGDIVLTTEATAKVSYWAIWPHARPWRWQKAEPMLRSVPDANKVGEILTEVLATENLILESKQPVESNQIHASASSDLQPSMA